MLQTKLYFPTVTKSRLPQISTKPSKRNPTETMRRARFQQTCLEPERFYRNQSTLFYRQPNNNFLLLPFQVYIEQNESSDEIMMVASLQKQIDSSSRGTSRVHHLPLHNGFLNDSFFRRFHSSGSHEWTSGKLMLSSAA